MVRILIILCLCHGALCGVSCGGFTCDELVSRAAEIVDATVAVNRSCEQNDDCVLVSTSTDCLGTCGAIVSKESVEDVRSAVSKANRKYSKEFKDNQCTFITPSCAEVVPVCNQGLCGPESLP